MSISTNLRKYLLSKSAITSLVGTRMFPRKIPQKNSAFPVIVYRIVSQDAAHHLAGGAGYAGTRIQLDVYSETETETDALAEAIRNQMQGYSGAMGTASVTSVVLKNSQDLYEPPQDNSDTGLYRNSTDYWLRHDMAVPTFA